MPGAGARRWWRSRSQAARVDLYVRSSLYANLVVVPALAAGAVFTDFPHGPSWLLVAALTAAHAVLCGLLVRAGLDHSLGRRDRPDKLIVAGAVATVAGIAAGILAFPERTPGHPDGPATAILLVLLAAYATAVATTTVRAAAAVAAFGCAAAYLMAVAQDAPDPSVAAFTLAALLAALVAAYRVSVWLLGVVWELDGSRDVRARLAVAEERLRFARDLHDVVGRTLSVVALKAELSARLARRGRDQAADEMLEVRRIAQESLVELRALVGGYRTADLPAELAGARELLAAAGVTCTVDGDGGALPAEAQAMLGWVVREGTTNVLRHSEARACTITVREAPSGTVALTMENDGVPGGEEAVRPGNGLVGLGERLAPRGGEIITQRYGVSGFRLVAVLPAGAAPAQAVQA